MKRDLWSIFFIWWYDSSAIIKNVKKYKLGGEVIIGSSNNIYNS